MGKMPEAQNFLIPPRTLEQSLQLHANGVKSALGLSKKCFELQHLFLSFLVSKPRGYKNTFNSAEHELLNSYKYKHIKKLFLSSNKPRVLFFLLIKVGMSTIVGISAFISRKDSCSA